MNLAKYIDHTILKANTTTDQVKKICDEAREYGFMSVCVNSTYTAYVHEQLKGSDVKTCTVVGFPLGAMLSEAKAFETKVAVRNGSDEIDMVVNVGAMKEGNYVLVEDDIKAVVDASGEALVKVILETCLLTKEEIVKACEIAVLAGADFVKTSTGFSTGGATVEDVALMKKIVGDKAKVKASGGVRDYDGAMAVIEAGADRIGASAGVAIVTHTTAQGSGY